MLKRLLCLFLIGIALISCTDEEKRAAEQAKEEKKKEKVFESISSHWHFDANPLNASSQKLVAVWPAWRDLLREMSQKPQSSISAFQKKSKILSERVLELPKNIPPAYNKPQVKARISVLATKFNAINLFINLENIPAEKVNELVADVNVEMRGFQSQLDEIDRKALIPKEQGEADMIKMLDTARAIPDKGFKPEDITQPNPDPALIPTQKPTRPKGVIFGGRDRKTR